MLEKGFIVRGTVRSLKNQEKVRTIRELVNNPKHPLELVEADCNDKLGWKAAVVDCDYVIHTASPMFTNNPKHPDIVIKPAVDGTLNVLEACYCVPRVKCVVVTSSIAAILDNYRNILDVNKPHTENDWPSHTHVNFYCQSKVLAEKAAWDFMKKEPRPTFNLCTINPSVVFGPIICGTVNESLDMLRRLINRKIPMVPDMYLSIVDVRDVAEAHVRAMTLPEAVGHRHIISAQGIWVQDLAKCLDEEFSSQGYNIPTRKMPNFLIWILSWFSSAIQMVYDSLGKEVTYDNTRMTSILGIVPRPLKDTILDSAYSMIEQGHCKRTEGFKSRTLAAQPK